MCVSRGGKLTPGVNRKATFHPHVIHRAAGPTGAVILGPQAGASVLTWSGQVCLCNLVSESYGDFSPD